MMFQRLLYTVLAAAGENFGILACPEPIFPSENTISEGFSLPKAPQNPKISPGRQRRPDPIYKKAPPSNKIVLLKGGGFLIKGGFLNNNTPDISSSVTKV